MSSRQGLCIDGPMQGRIVTFDGSAFYYREPIPVRAFKPYNPNEPCPMVRDHCYGAIGFWKSSCGEFSILSTKPVSLEDQMKGMSDTYIFGAVIKALINSRLVREAQETGNPTKLLDLVEDKGIGRAPTPPPPPDPDPTPPVPVARTIKIPDIDQAIARAQVMQKMIDGGMSIENALRATASGSRTSESIVTTATPSAPTECACGGPPGHVRFGPNCRA